MRIFRWLRTYLKVAVALRTPLVYLQDTEYVAFSLEDWQLNVLKVMRLIRSLGFHLDCDDYAAIMEGELKVKGLLAVGRIWGWSGGFHVWNIIIANKGIYQFEPQSGQIKKRFPKRIPVFCIL